MIAWLWQFLAGYVTIKVEGLKLLAFVNDAAANGILLKGAERQSFSRIVARVSWRDYRRLLALARNRPLRVVATAQGGVPHIAARAVKRLAFTIGLVLCVASLAAVNQFVLDVRVTGCTKPGLSERVLQAAGRQGLVPGAAKAALDLAAVEKSLMLEISDISFAAVRVSGVVATVNVVEGVPAPPVIDRNKPCDVTALRDGVVRKVLIYDGQANVAVGEAVRRGQVLVSSAVTVAGSVKIVHARADVLASVWYEGRGSAPLFSVNDRLTGAVVERRKLAFAGFELPTWDGGEADFAAFVTEEASEYLLGPGLKGPKLVTLRIYETDPRADENDFRAALDEAVRQALNAALSALPAGAQVLGSRTIYGYADGNLIVRAYIETLENIAVETPAN